VTRTGRNIDSICTLIYVSHHTLEVYICDLRIHIEGALKEQNRGKILPRTLPHELNCPHEVEIQQPSLGQQ